MNFDDKFRNFEAMKNNMCYQSKRRIEKEAELLWWGKIFLGVTH